MILKNGLVVDAHFTLKKCDLQFENGRITRIADNLEGDEITDVSGCYVLPGFIDSHMHGAVGHKISDINPAPDFEKITRYEASQGVTSLAISTVCSDFEHLLRQVDRAVAAAQLKGGAKIAAIHAEGPFINPSKKGAMDENAILSPSREQLDQLIAHGQGLLRLITLPSCILWVAYNCYIGTWEAAIADCLALISILIAMYKFDYKKKAPSETEEA